MRRLLAVTARELRERWLLFPASLLFGFGPLVLPAFGVDRRAMPLVGVVTALGLAGAAAALSGSTMLARDAADGRLAFLFSRPVSWTSIWGGKWLAAVLLVAASGLLAALPTILTVPVSALSDTPDDSWLHALRTHTPWPLVLLLLFLGVAASNFAATAYRSRSPWVAFDMAVLGVATWVGLRYVAPLWLFNVLDRGYGETVLLPVTAGLLAGSAAQAALGRTDLRRAHRALSMVLWGFVGVALAVGAGYWHWILSASPADVKMNTVVSDPTGRWIFTAGNAPRGALYPYGYLIDTATGRWTPRPAPVVTAGRAWIAGLGTRFSADGRHFAELRVEGRGAAVALIDLASSPPRVTHVSLESSPPPDWYTQYALAPAGDSVFVAHDSGVSVFGLPAGRRLATRTVPPGWRPAAVRSTGAGAFRTWLVPWNLAAHAPAPRAELLVIDLAADGRSSGSIVALEAAHEGPAEWGALAVANDGSRIVTFDGGTHLRDAATGGLLATLSPWGMAGATTILADGRVLVVASAPANKDLTAWNTRVRVFDRTGAPLVEWPLRTSHDLGLTAELAPGRVLLSSFPRSDVPPQALVLDLSTGQVVQTLSGLGSIRRFFFPPRGIEELRVAAVQFLADASGRIVRHDFATGAETTVAGPGAPRGERIDVGW